MGRFVLPDERMRSALEWYRKRGPAGWTANVSTQHAEELVDAILLEPPELPALPARPPNANSRRLRLKKLTAHRFAGLHKFGTLGTAPENYVHEFTSALTLFEGRNGSGKTSLLNAIIWALTGEVLRPQREPEAIEDFDCWVVAADGGDEQTTHKLSPLTPMPNVDQYRPDHPWVPADTWVELTFVDDTGAELPVIRRSQSRSPQGKLKETSPDLSILGVDPIAVRIGTIMPGLLPLIKVGSESELGRAVSQLTGLSALVDLAEHARTRLYARVATWIADHPDPQRKDDTCVVCSGDLERSRDPVTGELVKVHLQKAAADAALLSQTLSQWAENAQGDLMRNLPEALRAEMTADLPAHPCDLLRNAIVNELFSFEPFRGVLGDLKGQTASAFDDIVKDCAALLDPAEITLPHGCDTLTGALKRLDCAIRFARWRQSNDCLAREIVTRVLGWVPKEGESSEGATLTGKLLYLEATVKAAKPVSDVLVQTGRLNQHLKARRAAERRLAECATASAALGNLGGLGQLADEQVDQLRKTLRQDAAAWRSRIYLGAFPDTAHKLVDTSMGRKGELDLVVQAGGVSAPAQHVTNASALRASLVAFFLAFWEYVLKERGGLTTLALDDPQELLDDENRERLAAALAPLAAAGAQLIVTSYDPRFCARVSRLPIQGGIEHLEVHPATRQQQVVRTTPPLPAIEARKIRFDADRNAEEPAREFADGCRVFFEAKLGDMFDDPAHAAWAIANPDPTLATFMQRLRPLVRSGPQGMFSAHVFRRFAEHPALVDGSPVIVLMNKAHHGRREEIRAADVAQCADDLIELLEIVEQMYEECYRWRRRDAPKDQSTAEIPVALVPMARPKLDVVVCPDLAAFTQHASAGESQEPPEYLNPHLLDSAAAYYLRRPNFGFAAPVGSIALVEAVPSPAADRRLVIARHRNSVYARRLVRGANAGVIGLTAEVLDPRTRTPKTIFLSETEIAIHQVIGIIFDHSIAPTQGQDEAVLVDASDVLKKIEIAYRVTDESAVPLALENQVVLGGTCIELDVLGQHKDALVALTLDDGSGIFKRVGAVLPGELAHLRQFESIGGLGSSEVLSIGKPHRGLRSVTSARVIIGVLYHG